jgi:hypothetical protein
MKPTAPHTVPPLMIYFFLIVGLVSAVAFRLVTIVGTFNPGLVRPVWYVGVIGYIIFFAYRFYITEKRRKTIYTNRLLEKIRQGGEINREDRELISYVLSSIIKSKEHINYLFIFLLSIVAIAADIILAG